MDCSPPGSSIHGSSPHKYTEVGGHAHLQGSFPTQVSNPGLKLMSASQADSLLSEPPGKRKNTGVGSLSLFQGIFLTQESNRGILHCKWVVSQMRYQKYQEILLTGRHIPKRSLARARQGRQCSCLWYNHRAEHRAVSLNENNTIKQIWKTTLSRKVSCRMIMI